MIKDMLKSMKLNRKFTLLILTLMMVPICIYTIILFNNIEQNTISARTQNLEFTLEREANEITKNVENINISTQFFVNDKALIDFIRTLKKNPEFRADVIKDLYEENFTLLEKVVENTPNINEIIIYIDDSRAVGVSNLIHDYVELVDKYHSSTVDISGWNFGINTLSKEAIYNSQTHVMSCVTPIVYRDEELGFVEASIKMDAMFPDIYNSDEKLISFYRDQQGNIYCNEKNEAKVAEYMEMLHDVEGFKWNTDPETTLFNWKNEQLLVGVKYVDEVKGTIINVSNISEELNHLRKNRNMYILTLVLIAIIMVVFINNVVKSLLSQFYKIQQAIREIQNGDLNVKIEDSGKDEMGELGQQINTMMERIKELMEENVNRERLVKNSEIRSLQNQINAHFIYNVLESIKMMAEIDEKYDISDAITALGKLLRYSMHWTSGKVTVGEELEYIRNYLALINLRYDYEIYLSLNMPNIILKQEVPKMSLQPIVENAIIHGIEQIAEDTNIYVKGRLENGDCIIEVTDAGKGMTEEQVLELTKRINGEIEDDEIKQDEKKAGKGNGIGLKNVQDRIKMNFGEKYGLTIKSKLGIYTKVEMRVPQTYFLSMSIDEIVRKI